MLAYLLKLLLVARTRLKSRASLEAENLTLRQRVIVLSRKSRSRVRLRNIDRLIFVWLYRCFPAILNAITVVKPETVIRWHRCGFRAYWRWKSRRRGGRPKIDCEIRDLIRRMSRENPLWGAPRIHGELLKLGIEISETSVAKYMVRRRKPPSQTWRTFLNNHVKNLVSIDFFTATPAIPQPITAAITKRRFITAFRDWFYYASYKTRWCRRSVPVVPHSGHP